MLSVGKLGSGQETYYLTTVAAGVEDYYVGAGEVPGRWTGSGAPGVGLDGEVGADQLRAVLGGLHPRTGEHLGRRAQRVPGFDLTFSAPKSVSLLFGLGPSGMAGTVVEAHELAVETGLAYLERHGIFTRHRRGDELVHVPARGLVVAAFRHRTSRAGDPQLHTHCLVANLVQSIDGPWRTLDSRSLYHHAKTAGFVYQAVLRAELTRRLGAGWTDVNKGFAEVRGIEPAALQAFSRRRAEVEAALEERGASSREAARAATLHTRRAKEYGIDAGSLRDGWLARAAEVGLEPDRLVSLSGQCRPATLDVHRIANEMAGSTGLTLRRTAFERRDVVQAWCERLPPGTPVDLDRLDELADGFLSRHDVVRLIGHEARRRATRASRRPEEGDGSSEPQSRRSGYSMRIPLMARPMTRRWISDVPSKIV